MILYILKSLYGDAKINICKIYLSIYIRKEIIKVV
jgi:hypothetical protein